MQVTVLLMARCPVCGFRNQGVQVGTGQPRMSGMRLEAGSIGWTPPACTECDHPLYPTLFDKGHLDVESTAKLRAWRDRQRAQRTRQTRRSV